MRRPLLPRAGAGNNDAIARTELGAVARRAGQDGRRRREPNVNGQVFPVLLLALVLDAAVGDPRWLYRLVPHPVALLGRAVEKLEARLNDPGARGAHRFALGSLVVVGVVLLAGACGVVLQRALSAWSYGWIVEAALVSVLLAFRGLYEHVRAVAVALPGGLAPARRAVRHVVGRDPESLDAPGLARAAIESTAENFSDGVVAPAFWYVLLGLPGMLAYKAVNTLDSMLGHRDERYEHFGKFAARLDDAMNWLPARLSGLLVCAAAWVMPGASAAGAWRSLRRDASRHRSVNAGWQEAAFAGALDLALAGPRRYQGRVIDDAWMGRGRRELQACDVHAALRLYLASGAVLAALTAVGWLLAASGPA